MKKSSFKRKMSIFMALLFAGGLLVPAVQAEAKEAQYIERIEKGIVISNEKKYALMYADGNKAGATAFKYDNIGEFSDGLAKIKKEGKYGYIDEKGKEVIKPEYDDADNNRT